MKRLFACCVVMVGILAYSQILILDVNAWPDPGAGPGVQPPRTGALDIRLQGDPRTGQPRPSPPTRPTLTSRGACCVGNRCGVTIQAECHNGVYQGDGTTCDSNPCATPTPPPETGACCLINGECIELTREDCRLKQGEYLDGKSCNPNPCATPTPTPVTEACCLINGECIELTREDCRLKQGEYLDGKSCNPNPCATPTPLPARGACCFSNGNCQELTTEGCNSEGGTYKGGACVPNPCDQPPPPPPPERPPPNS